MVIGFDTLPLSGGHAGRGTGSYTRNLFQGLRAYAPDVSIVPFNNEVLSESVDLIHYPYFDPFFLTLHPKQKTPFVCTVHDLIPLVYKDYFPAGIRGTLKWNVQKRNLKKASSIITDSEISKKDIVNILGIDESHVHVVYLAPGEEFIPQSKERIDSLKEKYHLSDEYLLYVGDVNWNKNIHSLLSLVSSVKIPIVLAGNVFLNSELVETQKIRKHIHALGIESFVITPGYIPAEELPVFYAGALLYVQLSYAEGFGLPVLESMACGTPALVSSTSSLREIAGPAIQVDPYNMEDIIDGAKKALSEERKTASKTAIAWAKRFSWKQTVKQTVDVYKQVVSKNS
jgi:glycosyltransferase involved in cell wall biosynthesis